MQGAFVTHYRQMANREFEWRLIGIAAVALSTASPILLLWDDAAGWILLYMAGALAVVSCRRRTSWSGLAAAIGVWAAYASLSVFSAYVGTLPGDNGDAARFRDDARLIARQDNPLLGAKPGARAYVHLLGMTYWIFGESELLGHAINVVAVVCTSVVLCRIRDVLGGTRDYWPIVLFSLLPTVVLFRAALLREAIECALFSSTAYFGLRWAKGHGARFGLIGLATGFAGAMMHPAMAIGLIGGVLLLAWHVTTTREFHGQPNKRRVAQALVATIAVVVGGATIAGSDRRVDSVLTGWEAGEDHTLVEIQTGRGAASYASLPGMRETAALRIAAGVIYYNIAPFPWQVRSWIDAMLVIENFVRLIFWVGAFFSVRRNRGHQARLGMVLLAWAAFQELVWAAGTTNWGTAARHHIPASGVVFALAFLPWLSRRRKSSFQGDQIGTPRLSSRCV